MNKIQVSVICTNYNKGDWIADAIESFLSQKANFTYEILLIDDASTDHSVDVIKKYAKKYPDKIHAFYNNKNLGITKTWIKICKEAKGKYIARCDGDDFWIDEKKLQKQVDVLEKSKDSLWCSTDYSIATPDGVITHQAAFEEGLVQKAHSYEKMLATKGLIMASTWLVETTLMNEINASIDKSAVDDTFNIQLDLFQKTKLTYIPEPTAAYRGNEGSDSRPIEMEAIKARNKRLMKTQLEYIEKYKNTDHKEIIKILLRENMNYELLATERLQLIHTQRRQMEEQEENIHKIRRSVSYRVGRTLTMPVRILKRWIHL